MRLSLRTFVAAALATIAGTGVSYGQAGQTGDKHQAIEDRQAQIAEHKAEVQKQREDMIAARREDIQKQRDQLKQQRDQALADRHELLQEFRDLQKQLHDQVKAGQLSKDQAHDRLKAWRAEHKPERPDHPQPTASSGGGTV